MSGQDDFKDKQTDEGPKHTHSSVCGTRMWGGGKSWKGVTQLLRALASSSQNELSWSFMQSLLTPSLKTSAHRV